MVAGAVSGGVAAVKVAMPVAQSGARTIQAIVTTNRDRQIFLGLIRQSAEQILTGLGNDEPVKRAGQIAKAIDAVMAARQKASRGRVGRRLFALRADRSVGLGALTRGSLIRYVDGLGAAAVSRLDGDHLGGRLGQTFVDLIATKAERGGPDNDDEVRYILGVMSALNANGDTIARFAPRALVASGTAATAGAAVLESTLTHGEVVSVLRLVTTALVGLFVTVLAAAMTDRLNSRDGGLRAEIVSTPVVALDIASPEPDRTNTTPQIQAAFADIRHRMAESKGVVNLATAEGWVNRLEQAVMSPPS